MHMLSLAPFSISVSIVCCNFPLQVFRNESLDATHLAEFHQVDTLRIVRKLLHIFFPAHFPALRQVEGVVADVGLTLGDLIGTIRVQDPFEHKRTHSLASEFLLCPDLHEPYRHHGLALQACI